jgi:tRNA-(ms[2]io[6]A)-hydroxylase
MGVLRLQLPTDPRWVNTEKNIEEILTDHAWCEQKAATNANITNNSEHQDLVVIVLAKEEIDHFNKCTYYHQARLKVRRGSLCK